MRRACGLLVLAGLSMAGRAPGQDAGRDATGTEVVVELGVDASGSGPQALVWLRDELVPAAAGWPRGADPRGAIRVTFGVAFAVSASPCPESTLANGALAASVRARGRTIATVAGGPTGEETLVPCEGVEPPELVRELGALLGTGPGLSRHLRVDLPSLLGAFGSRRACSEQRATQIALLAAHVGEVRLEWSRHGQGAVLHGRSAGGLAVPLALAWAGYAALRAERSAPLDEGEAIAVRAQALRDAGREEAARQLARIATPSAHEALLRLCRADEYTRVLAMESLARRGDPTALAALVDAATEAIPDTIDVARAALLAQWGTVGTEQKQSLLARLHARREGDLRGIGSELGSARLAAVPGVGAEPGVAVEAPSRPSPLWLLLPLALGVVLLRALGE